MILSVEINDRTYRIDSENPLDIAIPLDFYGAQPNAYGVERATSVPCAAGELIGDTRRGGSCNFERVTLIPHCNGTHTESVGHITHERISVHQVLRDAFIPAALISVEPERAGETSETYSIDLSETDELITKKSLENALRSIQNPKSKIKDLKPSGLIVRTLPNDESKKTRTYLDDVPPFFSTEAMKFIVGKGVRHLLVDLPSIDRIFDEGKLSNHRIFWNITQGAFETNENSLVNNTITELIFAASEIRDGVYLLNLQIAPFASDAAPSRPILFNLI